MNQSTRNRLRKRYFRLRFKIEKPILDLGGYDGRFLEMNNIQEATILDLTKNKNPKYKYIKADLTKKLPKLNGKFKTIFLTEVLEHLRNPLYLMAQVYDLLDEKGTCYISIPYTKLETRRFAREDFEQGHVSRWKRKEILDQMKKIGFKARVIQKRRRFFNIAFWSPHCWLVLELKK
jgi:hypothetical protein